MTESQKKSTKWKRFEISPFSIDTFKPFTFGNSVNPIKNNPMMPTPLLSANTPTRVHDKLITQSRKNKRDPTSKKSQSQLPQRSTTINLNTASFALEMANYSPKKLNQSNVSKNDDLPNNILQDSRLIEAHHVKLKKNVLPLLALDHDDTVNTADTLLEFDSTNQTSKNMHSSSMVNKFRKLKIPHDCYMDHYAHSKYCSISHPSMVPKSLAYFSRHRVATFGKSNRLPFLCAIYTTKGPCSVRPFYSATYDGTGGQGRQYALGLSVTESIGDDRILAPTCKVDIPLANCYHQAIFPQKSGMMIIIIFEIIINQ